MAMEEYELESYSNIAKLNIISAPYESRTYGVFLSDSEVERPLAKVSLVRDGDNCRYWVSEILDQKQKKAPYMIADDRKEAFLKALKKLDLL